MLAAAALLGCGGAAQEVVGESKAPPAPDARAVPFAYRSLDGRAVSSAASRGRPVVLVYGTIDNLLTQAQARYLQAMAAHDADRIFYCLVLVDPADRRELAELYRQNLKLTFPVALADDDTLGGRTPFGPIEAVPVVLVLDREGNVVLRRLGLVKAEELRASLRGL
mgnify:FL=1